MPKARTELIFKNEQKEAQEQYKVEAKNLLDRWFYESDLDAEELSSAAVEAIEEWLDEEVIGFQPE